MINRKDLRRWQSFPYLTKIIGEFSELPRTLMYNTEDGVVLEREAMYKGRSICFERGHCIGVGYFRIGDKLYEVDAAYTKQEIQLYKFVKSITSSRGVWRSWDKDSDVVFEIDKGHGVVRGKEILTVVMNCMVEFCGPCNSVVIRRYSDEAAFCNPSSLYDFLFSLDKKFNVSAFSYKIIRIISKPGKTVLWDGVGFSKVPMTTITFVDSPEAKRYFTKSIIQRAGVLGENRGMVGG